MDRYVSANKTLEPLPARRQALPRHGPAAERSAVARRGAREAEVRRQAVDREAVRRRRSPTSSTLREQAQVRVRQGHHRRGRRARHVAADAARADRGRRRAARRRCTGRQAGARHPRRRPRLRRGTGESATDRAMRWSRRCSPIPTTTLPRQVLRRRAARSTTIRAASSSCSSSRSPGRCRSASASSCPQRRDELVPTHAQDVVPVQARSIRTRGGFIDGDHRHARPDLADDASCSRREPIVEVDGHRVDDRRREEAREGAVARRTCASSSCAARSATTASPRCVRRRRTRNAARRSTSPRTGSSGDALAALGDNLPHCRTLVLTANPIGDDGIARARELEAPRADRDAVPVEVRARRSTASRSCSRRPCAEPTQAHAVEATTLDDDGAGGDRRQTRRSAPGAAPTRADVDRHRRSPA